ncbi:hypothetical protein [Streptomyces sp. NPDC058964]|uniref:hypothetical protein n=1 Tax=Streptomyces sp. NPDC058964 TaxID=3346681 RepID=UPI0036CAA95A
MRFHSPACLRVLREACDAHDVLLVFDTDPTGTTDVGDIITVIAADDTFSEWRSKLVGQARDKGMKAPCAKEWAEFAHKDGGNRGPDPGSPWYEGNPVRGADLDVWGALTNGGIGTKNSADAFLGTSTTA